MIANIFHTNQASIPIVGANVVSSVASASAITASFLYITAATASIAPSAFTLLQLNGAVGNPARINIDTNNSVGTFGSSMRFRRSHGTADNPGLLLSGDVMGQIVGDGWVGTGSSGFINGACQLQFVAEDNWSTSSTPSYISFRTTPANVPAPATGSTSEERLRISSDGNLHISQSIFLSGHLYGTASVANTASYVLASNIFGTIASASYAVTASHALSAVSASYAPGSPSISASYALTSSFSISASYAPGSPSVSSSYAESASYATTASHALTSISASSAVTASYTVYSAAVTTSINNTTTSIISNPNTIYSSMFVNYVLSDTQNFRAGNIVVLYTTSSAVLSETCTTDIGNSNGLQFSASISASFVNLLVVNSTPNDYSIKYHYDVL